MTYEQARKFIEQTTKFGSILGLVSMNALMDELGNVQNNIPIIHIAGTNGKGSVGAYLASILKEAGLKVGRYCSPAVFHPLECWQYDGRMITEHEYADIMSQVKKACDIVVSKGIQPTVFEVETAAAFVYFSQMPTDILLLETGLGGETDATNVVKEPLACVFTNISRDHMQFLGETLTEIAIVKAGIIKKNAYVFSAKQEAEVEDVLKKEYAIRNCDLEDGKKDFIEQVAKVDCECPLYCKTDRQGINFIDETKLQLISQKPGELLFSYKGIEYSTQLSGIYQLKNAALAIEVAEKMLDILCITRTEKYINKDESKVSTQNISSMERGECLANSSDNTASKADTYNINSIVARNMIQNGIKNAVWAGRFEVLTKEPLCMIDGAHNEDAACMLSKTLENCFTKSSLVYIIGVLADKEHKQMLKVMHAYADKVYTITPPNTRALDANTLAEEAKEFYADVTACESIEQAVKEAFSYAKQNEKAILAFGSLSYLSELKDIVCSNYSIMSK